MFLDCGRKHKGAGKPHTGTGRKAVSRQVQIQNTFCSKVTVLITLHHCAAPSPLLIWKSTMIYWVISFKRKIDHANKPLIISILLQSEIFYFTYPRCMVALKSKTRHAAAKNKLVAVEEKFFFFKDTVRMSNQWWFLLIAHPTFSSRSCVLTLHFVFYTTGPPYSWGQNFLLAVLQSL